MAGLFAIILIHWSISTQKGFKPKSYHFRAMRVGVVSLDLVLAFTGKYVQLWTIEEGHGTERDRWGVFSFSNLMGQLTILLYWY